jgi:hypothetical protein
MKRLLLPLAIILITSSFCFAQNSFRKGLIVTAKNDTIDCLVPVTTSFGKQFLIKKDQDAKQEKVLVHDIKYLATEYNVYETVQYMQGKKAMEKLMQIMVEGKINLYMDCVVNSGPTQTAGDASYAYFTAPSLTFVVKKEGETFYLNKKNYTEVLAPLMSDLPQIASKLGKDGAKFEDLEQLILSYNTASN